jgi:hypothetical protein
MIVSAAAAGAAIGVMDKVIDYSSKARDVANTIDEYTRSGSLVEYTKSARVEPLLIIGSDCVNLEYMPEVAQTLQSLFSGYYLQGVALMTQVNGVSVAGLLDRLNPDRNANLMGVINHATNQAYEYGRSRYASESMMDWRACVSSYRFRLPTTSNPKAIAFEQHTIAVEANSNNSRDAYYNNRDLTPEEEKDFRKKLADAKYEDDMVDKLRKHEEEGPKKKRDEEEAEFRKNLADARIEDEMVEKLRKHEEDSKNKTVIPTSNITSDNVKSVRELADLSVGKMVNITFGGGKDKAGNEVKPISIPISIRLMANTMPESSLINLLCAGSMDHSMVERYHAWRSGRIGFIRDLILCQDMINAHKKASISDNSGVHGEIVRRVNNAKIAGLAQKDPSLNVASNLFVISEVTAANIEHKLGGKLSSPSIRNKIFNAGYAMIITVIDRQYERITFYHRGIAASTTVSLRDIKVANKGSGPDIGDILKAYSLGNSPQL